jgi:glucosamine--fructose-6-phosphate aminotransferase (isomerizing)
LVGIIGYIGTKNAMPILLRGLKSLEKSDYDSVGIATLSASLKICKGIGKMESAVKDKDLMELEGNIGIAHTRRATHGRICIANAHPHTDCKKRVAIVHNGIIENHKELKEQLIGQGHIFTSSTDSEVIAHLIEEKLETRNSFEKACKDSFQELAGCYALLAITQDAKKVVAFRKDLPLAMGLADGGFIFTSNVHALQDWTVNVVYVQNYNVAVACRKEVVMQSLMQDKDIDSVRHTLGWVDKVLPANKNI